MKSYLLSDQAEIDLEEIHGFISMDSPNAADRWIRRIDKICNEIATFQRIGTEREYLGPGVRGFPVGAYLILYRITDNNVEVLRVVSGYRDIESLF